MGSARELQPPRSCGAEFTSTRCQSGCVKLKTSIHSKKNQMEFIHCAPRNCNRVGQQKAPVFWRQELRWVSCERRSGLDSLGDVPGGNSDRWGAVLFRDEKFFRLDACAPATRPAGERIAIEWPWCELSVLDLDSPTPASVLRADFAVCHVKCVFLLLRNFKMLLRSTCEV